MLVGLLLIFVQPLACQTTGRSHQLSLAEGSVWLVSVATCTLTLVVIGWDVYKRFDDVLIDRDNRITRPQHILWILLVMYELRAAGIFDTSATFSHTVAKDVMLGPFDVRFPPEIWALLGLCNLTAVAAPLIKNRNRARQLRDSDAR